METTGKKSVEEERLHDIQLLTMSRLQVFMHFCVCNAVAVATSVCSDPATLAGSGDGAMLGAVKGP